jgi:hypothetical protein
VVEGEAKSEGKELERRRLDEQAQVRRIAADAEAKGVLVEGEAKSEAKEVERRRLEEQAQATKISADTEAKKVVVYI